MLTKGICSRCPSPLECSMYASDSIMHCIPTNCVGVATMHLDAIDIVEQALFLVLAVGACLITDTHGVAKGRTRVSGTLTILRSGLQCLDFVEGQGLHPHQHPSEVSSESESVRGAVLSLAWMICRNYVSRMLT